MSTTDGGCEHGFPRVACYACNPPPRALATAQPSKATAHEGAASAYDAVRVVAASGMPPGAIAEMCRRNADELRRLATAQPGANDWEAVKAVADVADAALALYRRGYDGPMMGEDVRELFAALARLDACGPVREARRSPTRAEVDEKLRMWLVDYRKGNEGGVALFSDRSDAVAAMERWAMDGEPVEVRAVVERLATSSGVR